VSQLFDLSGRVAVVTGALGQLGPIWTEGLLSAGAVVAAIDLPQAANAPGFTELEERYGRARLKLYRGDIRESAQLIVIRDHCQAELGVPAVLVNNAGLDQPPNVERPQYRLEEIPIEVFDRIMDVNVLGTFRVIQAFGAAMVEAGRGSIINIGSLYASVAPDVRFYDHLPYDPPFLKPPAYGASKAAVVNLSRYLAALWGPSGVRVNSLSPGGVLGEQDLEFRRKYCERVPLGRMAIGSDLVGPLLFLASDASAYVTGIDLLVDGGFSAW
jgi:NAD(P)-dependent dehydrogenase (short-subunit alcohol dehydrogenase family)